MSVFMEARPRRQNFVCTVVEAQFASSLTLSNGTMTNLGTLLDRLNIAFTIVFSAELTVNAFSHWFRAVRSFHQPQKYAGTRYLQRNALLDFSVGAPA